MKNSIKALQGQINELDTFTKLTVDAGEKEKLLSSVKKKITLEVSRGIARGMTFQKIAQQFRELDETFSNGLMFPGDPDGGAAKVVDCRCALLQYAKWALDEKELETLKERAAYYGLDKNDNFEDFKKKYFKAITQMQNQMKITFPDGIPLRKMNAPKEEICNNGIKCKYR